MSEGAPKTKAWTPQELADHIKEICGAIVTEKLEPLMKRVTDHNAWIDGAKSGYRPTPQPTEKGLVVAGIIASMAAGKGDYDKALANAKSLKGNEDVVKALEAGTGTAGGFLIAPQQSEEFIDLLTPRAVVRSFNPLIIPMDSGSIQIPKLTAASTAYYIGENKDATKSQQSFGMKKLTARKLAVLVPVSNDLIRRGGPKVNTIVRNDALRSAALKEDVTFLRSLGTEFTPKGLRYLAAAANILTATGGSYTLDDVTADFGRLVLALEEANVALSNPGWIFAPRTKQFLMTLRDGLGNYVYRAEMLTGKFWGWPFRTTTQVPTNLNGAESEVYLADFDDVAIGQTMAIEVAMSTEASYKDENGDLVSAFSLDQTVMRILMEHDLGLRHDEAVAVLTAVPWTVGGVTP